MLTGFILGTIGPAGRWLVEQYLAHGAQLSLPLLVWMVVVGVGQYHAGRLQRQVKVWVQSQLNGGARPDVVLAKIEPQWQAATRNIRWMPAAKGWWTRPATDAGLREFVGFTPAGVERVARAMETVKAQQARRLAQVNRKRTSMRRPRAGSSAGWVRRSPH